MTRPGLLLVLALALPAAAQPAAPADPCAVLAAAPGAAALPDITACLDAVYAGALGGPAPPPGRVDSLAGQLDALADGLPRQPAAAAAVRALADNARRLGVHLAAAPCPGGLGSVRTAGLDRGLGRGDRELIGEIVDLVAGQVLDRLEAPLGDLDAQHDAVWARLSALCQASQTLGVLALHQAYLRLRADLSLALAPDPEDGPGRASCPACPACPACPDLVVPETDRPPASPPPLRAAVGVTAYADDLVGVGGYTTGLLGPLVVGAHGLVSTAGDLRPGVQIEVGQAAGPLVVLVGAAVVGRPEIVTEVDVEGIPVVTTETALRSALTGTVLYAVPGGPAAGVSVSTAAGVGVKALWAW